MTRISRARSALRDLMRESEGRATPARKETMQ
jgi:hypothetical protein